MNIVFHPARMCLQNALISFAEAGRARPDKYGGHLLSAASFAHGMLAIVGMQVGGDDGTITADDLALFWPAAVELIAASETGLCWYIDDAVECAMHCACTDEWEDVCIARTAIQLVLTSCPEAGGLFGREEYELLADMDETLRSQAAFVDSLPEPGISANIPADHWWWRLPTPDEDAD
ncbi:hypothetical protein ACIP5Y_39835 [Nocardia sp. NPDC088792]|uniref:hypothetical protein n=1 Tax=Nocardia sp. NPDC088792 TaxID=3364332 RepID=UPI003801A365